MANATLAVRHAAPAADEVRAAVRVGGVQDEGEVIKSAYGNLVDAYGQSTRGRWPEKVANDEQLKSAAAKEQQQLNTWLAEREKSSLDKFGGWSKGPAFKASGFFRTEKRDGRWYLVTLAMGTFFVLGQANEYRSLVEEVTTIPSSATRAWNPSRPRTTPATARGSGSAWRRSTSCSCRRRERSASTTCARSRNHDRKGRSTRRPATGRARSRPRTASASTTPTSTTARSCTPGRSSVAREAARTPRRCGRSASSTRRARPPDSVSHFRYLYRMARRTILVCDNCGKEVDEAQGGTQKTIENEICGT